MEVGDVTVIVPSMWERTSTSLPRTISSIEYQTVGIPRIVVVTGRASRADACNAAFDLVKTPWVTFMDDDDWMAPNHLETLFGAARRADLVYSSASIHSGGVEVGRWERHPTKKQEREDNHILSAFMVKTDLARSVGGFPDRMPEDWPFLLALLDKGARFRYAAPPEPTWVFNLHAGQTFTNGAVILQELAK